MVSNLSDAEMLLLEGNRKFACNLYKSIVDERSSDNVFFSPFSLFTALSMTHVGAHGNTADQIMSSFGLDESTDLHSILPGLLNSLRKIDTLSIANSIFIQKNFQTDPSFVHSLEDSYAATVRSVDFSEQPREAAKAVNKWVSESTSGKIDKLVDQFESNTVFVILNAVHFKSFWNNQFKPSDTQDEPFHLNRNSSVNVKLMYQSEKYRLGFNESADCDILEIPYKDHNISMLVFLPKDVEGLPKLEAVFDASFLKTALDGLGRKQNVDVYLPSFRLERELSLKSVMMKLGMQDMFCQGKADFHGISEDPTLHVSDVVHKSCIDVNEEGTEAAAVSAVIAVNYCARFNAVFRADHPFIFCIFENTSKMILFLGSVKNPTASS